MFRKTIDRMKAMTTNLTDLKEVVVGISSQCKCSIDAKLTTKTISYDALPAWHRVSFADAQLRCNEETDPNTLPHMPNDAALFTRDYHGLKDIKISEVVGIDACSENLSEYSSLEQMAADRYSSDINKMTESELNCILKNKGLRVVSHYPRSEDNFIYLPHFDRMYLSNVDGGHIFALAKYMANTLNKEVTFNAPLVIYNLNHTTIDYLQKHYYAVLICHDIQHFHELSEQLQGISLPFYYLDLSSPIYNLDGLHLYMWPKSAVGEKVYDVIKDVIGRDLFEVVELMQPKIEIAKPEVIVSKERNGMPPYKISDRI
jgi:hypothetical protein